LTSHIQPGDDDDEEEEEDVELKEVGRGRTSSSRLAAPATLKKTS